MKIYLLIFTILWLAVGVSAQEMPAQEMPADFTFSKTDADVYQVLPDQNKMISDAELGNAFQAIGIVSQPDKETFGLMFFNAQNEYQFGGQSEKPFILRIGEINITGSNLKVIKHDKIKKLKVEVLTVNLTREDFEKLLAADNVSVIYGTVHYDVSPSNLKAFHYTDYQIKRDYVAKHPAYQPSTNSGGTVQVRGYTRKDGTYVQPHTRSAPRKH